MADPLLPGPDGYFDVQVSEAGLLTLSAPLTAALDLEPGDLLALDPGPVSLHLKSYRDFLADNWEAVSTPNRNLYLVEFLGRPVAAVEPGGRITIPPEVFPLFPGDRMVLQVTSRGLGHELYLFRDEDRAGAPIA
jgi:hypothetical protein